MTNLFKIEHNLETQEIQEIELNQTEIAEFNNREILAQEAIDQAKAIQAAKEAAQSKLAALGLTTDDLKALGL